MSTAAFEKYLARQVEEIQDNFPDLVCADEAFAVWALHFLHDQALDEAAAWISSLHDGENVEIAGIIVDETDGIAFLLQARYEDVDASDLEESALRGLSAGLSRVRSERYAAQAGKVFEESASTVRAAIEGGADVVLQFVVRGDAGASLRTAELEGDPQIQVEVLDLAELDRRWTDRETVRDLRGEDVHFEIAGGELPFGEVQIAGLDSYGVVVLDGHSLAEAAVRHGARLVDMNVRYQLRRTKINDAIAATATDPDEQGKFLVLNNGLTVICDKILFRSDSKMVLRNPQIVNGAQTALTIGDKLRQIAPGDVKVLARIIEVDTSEEVGRNLARQISEATNRQNPVSSADLKAHDPLQQRIDSDLRKLAAPWFYERRRNSWASLSREEKEAYEGPITKEELGQRYRAMTGEPARAITSKSAVFDSTSLYGRIFAVSVSVEHYVLAHRLFEYYHRLLIKSNVSARTELAETFDEDMRLLLMRARNQFAAHGSALAYKLLLKKYGECADDRALAVATGVARDGAPNDYLPLHQLVTLTLLKWADAKRATAVANDEAFSIKDEFERPTAFVELWGDAQVSAQYFKSQTLDRLPE